MLLHQLSSWFLLILSTMSLSEGFQPLLGPIKRQILQRITTSMSIIPTQVLPTHVSNFPLVSLVVADSSVSEDEVLSSAGQVSELPDPAFALVFAFIVFAGVAVLQFSLGDLTKEEGQARVRDFLQTKRETERKRGYFD